MPKKIALVLGILLLFSYPVMASAEMRPIKKIRAGIPPFEVIGKVLRGNQQAAAGIKRQNKQPTPYLTWLADPDARIQTRQIMADATDKVYAVRNLGNQLELSIGAVDYGVRQLHTPVLLITGNTDSTAIRLFMEGYSQLEPAIRRDLDHLHLALAPSKTAASKQPVPLADQGLRQVEQNVDYQVDRALARYEDRVRNGRLVVVGSVLDLTNQYGHGLNRLIIINVNGERDDQKLKQMSLMVRLDRQLLELVGRGRSQKAQESKPRSR